MTTGRRLHAFVRRVAFAASCESGATAIEFAFVAPFFIAVLLAIVQVSVIYIAQSYLESVTESAMRIVLTNQSYTFRQSDFNTAICGKVTGLFDCSKIIAQLQVINTTTATGVTAALPKFDSNGALVNA